MDTEATSPVAADDTAAATVPADTGVETEALANDQQQFDDDGNPIPGPEEDTDEEVDLDGFKLKVPKDQAQKVREGWLRQSDYTRKTQELAESRKAFEAERHTAQQASQAEIEARADVRALDRQLEQYSRVDWQAWHAQDQFAANAAFMEFQQAQNARQGLVQKLHQLTQQRVAQADSERNRRLETAKAELARDIPDWLNGGALKTLEGGVREYGFDRAEIEEFEDARMVKVLHDALQWREHRKSQQKAQSHLAAQQAQPAAKAKAATPPPQGLADNLSVDEWMRRRNAQLAKKAG